MTDWHEAVDRPRHRWVLACACLAAVAGALVMVAAIPPYAYADETAHLDYAYQVWHGRLPEFLDGVRLELAQGAVPPVQWASQHPPAAYLLLAPVVGPLVDAGQPVAAAYAARAVTVLAAAGTVLAAGWAARWATGAWGRTALTVPVLVAAHVWLLRLGGAVYTDVFLMLVVTLLLGLSARWARVGRRGAGAQVAWVLLPAVASATRLAGVPLALLCVAAVGLTLVLRRSRSLRDWAVGVVLPVVAAAAASGWFYLRNLALTGSVTGGHPDWAVTHLERETPTLAEVLLSGGFWQLSFRQFAVSAGWADRLNLVLFVLPAVVGTVAAALTLLRRRGPAAVPDRVIALLLVGAVAGVTFQQALYVTGSGGAMGRYLAVLVLPFALAVAAGISRWRWSAGLLVLWCLLHLVDAAHDLAHLSARFADAGLPTLPDGAAQVALGAHALLLLAASALVTRVAPPLPAGRHAATGAVRPG
jgi:hypothetical protein